MQEILDKNNIEYEAFDDNTENNGKKNLLFSFSSRKGINKIYKGKNDKFIQSN